MLGRGLRFWHGSIFSKRRSLHQTQGDSLSPDGRHYWDEQTRQWLPTAWTQATSRRISLKSVLVTCALLAVIGLILALGFQACAREMGSNPFSMGMLPLMGRS